MSGNADGEDSTDFNSAADPDSASDSDDSDGSDSDGESGGGGIPDADPHEVYGQESHMLADLLLRLKDSHEPRVEVCNSNGATGSSTKRLLARLLTLNA